MPFFTRRTYYTAVLGIVSLLLLFNYIVENFLFSLHFYAFFFELKDPGFEPHPRKSIYIFSNFTKFQKHMSVSVLSTTYSLRSIFSLQSEHFKYFSNSEHEFCVPKQPKIKRSKAKFPTRLNFRLLKFGQSAPPGETWVM